MCKNQHLTRFRSSLAIAVAAVGLVAGTSLPAAARTAADLPAAARESAAIQPGWAGREHMKIHRDLNYARVQHGLSYTASVPPDYCDLPSAGCESYLSN